MEDQRAVALQEERSGSQSITTKYCSSSIPFLSMPCNAGIFEITGHKVNCGAGYGLEVPCMYRF